MTLDVIGLAGELSVCHRLANRVSLSSDLHAYHLRLSLSGFDYHFDAMNTELGPNELNEAFHGIFKQPPKLTIFATLANSLPLLAPFVSPYIATARDPL